MRLVVVVLVLLLGEVSAKAKNGTADIANLASKQGVDTSAFTASQLADLISKAAIDYCNNVSMSTLETDEVGVVTKDKGLSAVSYLGTYSTFESCLTNAGTNLTVYAEKVGLAIAKNAKIPATLVTSYLAKQKKLIAKKESCTTIVNTILEDVYTTMTKKNPHTVIQQGVTAANDASTAAEWNCTLTAASKYANVTAYNVAKSG